MPVQTFHIVVRPFPPGEAAYAIGELVDTTAWRAAAIRSLVSRRYLRPAAASDLVPAPAPAAVSAAPQRVRISKEAP